MAQVIVFAAVGGTAVMVLRAAVRGAGVRLLPRDRVLLVGDGPAASILARKIRAHPEYGLELVTITAPAALDMNGHGAAQLPALIRDHDISRIIISPSRLDDEHLLSLLRQCQELSLKVSVLPQMFDVMGPSVEVDNVEGLTVLGLNPPVLSRSSRFLKRTMDIVGSGLILLVAAPLLAAIAVAIRLDSRGPIFFQQHRIGRGGHRFRLVKFRTMVPDAEARRQELLAQSDDPHWLKLDDDPRITRVGRFLRQTSLDELPQLWNVLKGDMSLVGPRPLIEAEDRLVEGWGRCRLDLTPGITGLWQVLGRTNIPFAEMVKLDYLYVTNWSLWTDARLVVRTLPTVLTRRGAN